MSKDADMSGSRYFIPVILLALGGVAGVFGLQLWEGRQAGQDEQLQAVAMEDLATSIESSVATSVGERMEEYLEQMKAETQVVESGAFPTEEFTTAIIAKLEQAMATGEIQVRQPDASAQSGDSDVPPSADVDSGRTDVAAMEFQGKQQPIEFAAERKLQEIHFVYDSAELTPGAERKTRLAAESIAEEQPSKVRIKGFSDTVGDPNYNEELSQRRAASVAELLVAAGVPAEIIEIQGMGESVLPEPTGDGIREPLNRCVAITAIR